MGVPISVPAAVWISVPTIAFKSPPFEPGGLVEVVNTVRDRPAAPRQISVTRIEPSNTRPSTVASRQNVSTMVFARRRRRPRDRATFMSLAGPGTADATVALMRSDFQTRAQQAARYRQDDEGNHEQDQPQRQQRRQFQAAGRAFRKLQGHQRS